MISDRVVIRGSLSKIAAILASIVLLPLGAFGLWFCLWIFQASEFAGFMWAVLAVSILFVWLVICVLWMAFGVAVIISDTGVARYGPLGASRLPREGLRIGRNTRRVHRDRTGKGVEKVSFYAMNDRKFVLLWDGYPGDPDIARIEEAAGALLGVPVEPMTGSTRAGFP